jgi:ribose transport system substrate-binding protein
MRWTWVLLVAILAAVSACSRQKSSGPPVAGSGGPASSGKYVLLDTMTDDAKAEKCKANTEDTLVKYPEVRCLVGLWAYNPPAMLAALKEKPDMLGKVAIVGFDENEETLHGIKEGHIYGTIVQQPFEFGRQSIIMLAKIAKGDRSVIPPTGISYVAHQVITKENVEQFHEKLKKLKTPGEPLPKAPAGAIKVAFISNNPYEFWTIARRGAEQAVKELKEKDKIDVDLEFHMPARGTAAEQRQIIEDLLTKGVKGIAISVNDAANQADFYNDLADKVPLITQDSDLPKGSKRLCYIGTNNVEAGKGAGELVKKACPEGGKYVIYVGKLDVQNAQERRQGVIEVLSAAK